MFGVRWGVLLAAVAAGAAAVGQGPAKAVVSTPVFDVTTVKPSQAANDNVNVRWNEATFTATNVALHSLLQDAFGIREDLISGLPGWAKSEHYDIVAKATDVDASVLKNLTREQRRAMMEHFIEDRFHVKSHVEVKQLPVYDLVQVKGGVKFKESPGKVGTEACKGWMSSHGSDFTMDCVQMETLTQYLAYQVQRTVIDKTGLPKTAGYDMKMKWQRENAPHADNGLEELPTIYTALQEQLGLKLEPSKGPVETLVIDQIEKPTEN